MKYKKLLLIPIFSTMFLCACNTTEDEISEVPEVNEQILKDDVTDYDELSSSELEVLAYGDDPTAQYKLGLLYEYGNDEVNQDFAKALEWYSLAAKYDYADAYTALGYLYLNGCGVDVDYDMATEYFEQAELLGADNAKVGLGRIILDELSQEELEFICEHYASKTVDSQAEEVIEDASDEDEAQDEAEADDKRDLDSDEASEFDEEDALAKAQKIFDRFKDAESAGEIDGLYFYGYILEKGIGIEQNDNKACAFYKKVLEKGSTKKEDQYAIDMSNIALGLHYMNGTGVIANKETAFSYFNAAAENGFAKAQFYVGQCYENGYGVEKDYKKAMEQYKLSADQSFAPALNQIGYLYYNGYGVDVDFSSAVYYQKLASLQGYAPAEVNLGYLFENGYGVERNLETALYYYELAAEADYEGAAEAVVRVRAQMNE